MINLWQQIAEIADFDKNGEVDTEEFMGGVETACKGKAYEDLPEAFKFFIEAQFRTIDVDGKDKKKIMFCKAQPSLISAKLQLCWAEISLISDYSSHQPTHL